MNPLTLGQKIKKCRERAGLSQLDLEAAINASPGSMSRIEADKSNPTKETLLRIVETLELSVEETGDLFNLEIRKEFPKYIGLATKLTSSLDLESTLQASVNHLVKDLGLLGGLIFLVEKGEIRLKYLTREWYTALIEKILERAINSLRFSLRNPEDEENLIYQTYLSGKIQRNNSLYEFARGVVSKRKTDFIAKFTKTTSIISLPIFLEKRIIGVLLVSKDYDDDFESDLPVLESFTEHIAGAINNARKYEELRKKLDRLKNKK